MDKKQIYTIYILNQQIRGWEKKRKYLQKNIETNDTNKYKLLEIEKIIDGKIAEIQYRIPEFERFIKTIDDPITSEIVEFRCVLCMSWREISIEMRNTEDNCRQIFHRFIEKLKR